MEKHKKELNIKKIDCWCYGESKDDVRGYDISYLTNDNKTILIEVKATKSNLNNKIYFEMSANEYAVMKANPNNYYIFL